MVYLFLANGFEEVEALTPLDYLRRCEETEIKSVSVEEHRVVTGSHGIPVMADILLHEVDLEQLEMMILPGGMPGTLGLEKSEGVQRILEHCISENKYIGAICAAPSILGHKGLLDGKKATCYTGFETQLGTAQFTGSAVERDGNLITARGAGTANQFAFALIETLLGVQRAEKLKAGILWE